MPYRRKYVRRSRGSKPRTRWVAVVPGSMVWSGNNQTAVQQISLSTALATFDWDELVGGTILRSIFDIVFSPTYPTAAALNWSREDYVHLGAFLSPEQVPDIAFWDPNAPHAMFMWREMMVETWYARQTSAGDSVSKSSSSHGQRMHIDSTQKRRIKENDRMWFSSRYFSTGNYAGAIGYTGRLLIQLP